MKHKINRLAYALPIMALLLLVILTLQFIRSGDDALQYQMRAEKRLDLDIVCDQVDYMVIKDNDWLEEYDFYEDTLRASVENFDSMAVTFAALYNSDFSLVSERSVDGGGEGFDPRQYDAFMTAAKNQNRGELFVTQERDDGQSEVYVYYRWVPMDKTLEGRFLAVIAVNMEMLNTHAYDRLGHIVVIAVIVTVILCMWMVSVVLRKDNDVKGGEADDRRR